jgi:hypothetical protein
LNTPRRYAASATLTMVTKSDGLSTESGRHVDVSSPISWFDVLFVGVTCRAVLVVSPLSRIRELSTSDEGTHAVSYSVDEMSSLNDGQSDPFASAAFRYSRGVAPNSRLNA